MSPTFAFGFENTDSDEEVEGDTSLTAGDHLENSCNVSLAPPQLHTLRKLLSTFPSQLSFSTLSVPSKNGTDIEIPRRELFDIRAQLMAEDVHPSTNSIFGLSNDDIIPNLYEGGFKTWECSLDLSDYIWSNLDVDDGGLLKDYTIVELGAGTALPSSTLACKWLSQKLERPEAATRLQVCLTDYNRSVLELATIPNLYLAMYFCGKTISVNDVETEPATLQQFEEDLLHLNVEVAAISGSWTLELADMVSSICLPPCSTPQETIVLASETIYSPASTRMFTETLLSILSTAQQKGGKAKALVAAKRVYFGVGGGADEFLKGLEDLAANGNIIWETQGPGVGRVLIEVTVP